MRLRHSILLSVTVVQRVCLIAGDAIVVIGTIYHTYSTVKASREANLRSTVSSTLLKAGMSRIKLYLPQLTWLGTRATGRCTLLWVRLQPTLYVLVR